jgi:hypothetical protein
MTEAFMTSQGVFYKNTHPLLTAFILRQPHLAVAHVVEVAGGLDQAGGGEMSGNIKAFSS